MAQFHKIKKFLLISIAMVNIGYAQQNLKVAVLSEADSTAVEYAHVFLDEKLTAYSDESGHFAIDLNRQFSSVTIKHLIYNPVTLTKNDLKKSKVVLMKEKVSQLTEVIIPTKKKTHKRSHTLLPEKSIKEHFMSGLDARFPYRFKNAVYVPNEFRKGQYTIQNIVFQARKGYEKPNTKYIPFKLNLMTVDTTSLLPKEKIFEKDLVVGKRENQKMLKVDVSGYNIVFPDDGIFVVVSLYEEDYYRVNGFIDRPGFGQTQTPKNSNFFELFWYPEANEWKEPLYSQERVQCRNFGIEVVEE